MTTTLPEFILARVAEWEALARAALEPVRNVHTGEDIGFGTEWEWYQNKVDQEWGEADHPGEQHVARHDPARVLAQCAAYRRILEALEDERQRKDIYNRDYDLGLLTTNGDLRSRLSANARWAGLDVAARALAAIWTDHEDYPEEWKL